MAIKRFVGQFVIQDGRLFRKRAHMVVPVVWANDIPELLQKTHVDYSHCGAHKLLQLIP